MLPRSTRLPDRSEAAGANDALSDVLRSVRMTGALFFRVEAHAPWSASAPTGARLAPVILSRAEHVISFHAVVSGSCWLTLDDGEEARLRQGEIVVLPHGDGYALSTSRRDHVAPDLEFFRAMSRGQLPFTVRDGGRGDPELVVLCGFLTCDLRPFNPLLHGLPHLLVVPDDASRQAGLRRLLELATHEAAAERAGGDCVLSRLSELLFIEAVREHALRSDGDKNGWLTALTQGEVGRALGLLHRYPERRWTLDSLAREAGCSRTGLVGRFGKLMGEAPMQYLTRWRMQKAAYLLAERGDKVSVVAASVGYESEAAFCRVFKRVVGASPGAWRRTRKNRA
jgi:AraC-like DNA-binding protein